MKTPGLYVPLDVNYVTDEGIRRAGPAAELLYIRGLAYSKRTQSDGFLPDYDMPVISVGLPQVRESITALTERELWLPVDGGWQIRSWQRWNETHKEAADKRKRAADRQRRSRDRRAPQDDEPATTASTQGDDREPATASGGDPDSDPDRHTSVTRDSPVMSRVTHSVVTPLKRREEKRRETTTSPPTAAQPAAPRTPPATRTRKTDDPDFDAFYAAYPRHEDKPDAVKAWKAALRRGADPQRLIQAAAAYAHAIARAGKSTEYTKLPATWLNKGSYDNEPALAATGADGPAPPASPAVAARHAARDRLNALGAELAAQQGQAG